MLSQYSDEVKQDIEIVNDWTLNERHYGSLQGFDKSETANKYGEEQVQLWRRSYDTPPPLATKNSDFDPNLYIDTMGWDPEIANSYTKTLKDMEKSKNRVFPLRVRGVFEFTSAVATGTSKALAGQLSPQEALDEVAKEWEAIVNRVGKKNVQEDYAVGVKMEDNKL